MVHLGQLHQVRVDRLVILQAEILRIPLLGQRIIIHQGLHLDQRAIVRLGLRLIQLLIQLVGQHHIRQVIV